MNKLLQKLKNFMSKETKTSYTPDNITKNRKIPKSGSGTAVSQKSRRKFMNILVFYVKCNTCSSYESVFKVVDMYKEKYKEFEEKLLERGISIMYIPVESQENRIESLTFDDMFPIDEDDYDDEDDLEV